MTIKESTQRILDKINEAKLAINYKLIQRNLNNSTESEETEELISFLCSCMDVGFESSKIMAEQLMASEEERSKCISIILNLNLQMEGLNSIIKDMRSKQNPQ